MIGRDVACNVSAIGNRYLAGIHEKQVLRCAQDDKTTFSKFSGQKNSASQQIQHHNKFSITHNSASEQIELEGYALNLRPV